MDRPWESRRLHFVGIGGAGHERPRARRARARRDGDRLRPLAAARRTRRGCARRGSSPSSATTPPTCPRAPRSSYSTRDPAREPRARGRERARELHRADLLGELTRLRPTIAVSGTHGKTTTSSMLVHALRGAGADPCYLVGGEVRSTGSNAGWGTGEWLVVEADESDRSLLKLDRRVAVLTNAELDHHATYRSRRDVEATFRAFLAPAEHAVVWDRPELLALAGGGPRVWPFDADARAVAGRLALRARRRRGRADRCRAPTTRSTPPPR